jgi:hypothetical protein
VHVHSVFIIIIIIVIISSIIVFVNTIVVFIIVVIIVVVVVIIIIIIIIVIIIIIIIIIIPELGPLHIERISLISLMWIFAHYKMTSSAAAASSSSSSSSSSYHHHHNQRSHHYHHYFHHHRHHVILLCFPTQQGDGAFIAGNSFSMADVFFFPILAWGVRGQLEMSAFPALNEYYKRVVERPSVKASWPPHWNEGPGKDFYAGV